MTAGEGGACVTNDDASVNRMGCMIDCCKFYWTSREQNESLFISNGSRASEIEGAVLNVQLKRIDPMIRTMRRQKLRILQETADTGLKPLKANSLDDECGTHVGFVLPTAEQADEFQRLTGCTIAGKTGRHVYTEWDPIFAHSGAPHPAMNPFLFKENAGCRMDYRKDMCAPSLNILNRTILFGTHPDRKRPDVTRQIRLIRNTAKAVLG
jgi:dTDP-4-amino-4,6-dideoxygalactose transaminase